MTRKGFLDYLGLIGVLAWIPLSIIAFYVSDVRLDIKLSIAAGVSFLSMIILWLKEN